MNIGEAGIRDKLLIDRYKVADEISYFILQWALLLSQSLSFFQINDLNQVPVPVMLLPDDFKANTKIKVNNHLFNK